MKSNEQPFVAISLEREALFRWRFTSGYEWIKGELHRAAQWSDEKTAQAAIEEQRPVQADKLIWPNVRVIPFDEAFELLAAIAAHNRLVRKALPTHKLSAGLPVPTDG